MSKLSYGLNITKKTSSLTSRPLPAKRKNLFEDDSGPEDGPDEQKDGAEEVTTIGGLHTNQAHSKPKNAKPASRSAKLSQFGNLSTNHSTSKHAQSVQNIDPSIYDYDAVYDSLHTPSQKSKDPSSSAAQQEKSKPKYMTSLLAAAEVRKRDALRAKEKTLAREREAEGDEFADKEKFVTGAYKRQQAEMARLEAEEAEKEKEAEERRKREGGGMKGLYKNILEKNEERHRDVVRAVQENKGKAAAVVGDEGEEGTMEKSEAEIAKEKGAVVNEEGIVVDKRQLLSAGLNASKDPAAKKPPDPRMKPKASAGKRDRRETSRERETRLFEEQLLGQKRGTHDDHETERASKSRKLEDEILGKLG